ncbi:hypothetical protein ENSA7_24670 [Enhygromyxa salina]|uniref:Uncharacterized protein n=1 Tax=Enhygromyxa salina TaxID=215803 RepID=A0A2S9YRS1_9BACT|nr:hypothetical protein ENSA7_24670 [Enhygromyxa salina]
MGPVLGCADKAPPARFPDPSPPVLAKPIEVEGPTERSVAPAGGSVQTSGGSTSPD